MSNSKDKTKPVVLDPDLYEEAKKKYAHMKHSAYKSGLVVSEYKKRGGRYAGKKPETKGLARWFKEQWRNQKGEVGYDKAGDIYRPTKRITKETPVTHNELSREEIRKAQNEKRRTGHVKRFRQTKETSNHQKKLQAGAQTKPVAIHWIRHAESRCNAIAKRGAWYEQIKRAFIPDPALSPEGVAEARQAKAPQSDLVVCSQLRRSIETALLLYPNQTIYVLCGLNEWIPGVPNTPLPKSQQVDHFAPQDWARVDFTFAGTGCGYFDSVDGNVFQTNLVQLLAQHPKCKSVSVVGHSQWFKHYLNFQNMSNLETKSQVVHFSSGK